MIWWGKFYHMSMEKTKGYIYKITNPSGNIYIGLTVDIDTRFSKYRNLNCKNQTRLYRSIKKYGWENHKCEVIETIISDSLEIDLKELEIKWIKHFNSFEKGLNCTIGGDGNSGRNASDVTRLKMRNAKLGTKQSLETIQKRVFKTKGKKRSDEFKERLRIAHTGKIVLESTKEKLRNLNLGRPSNNRIKCKLIDLELSISWEEESFDALSKICPISLPSIIRLKAGKCGTKFKNKYKLKYGK